MNINRSLLRLGLLAAAIASAPVLSRAQNNLAQPPGQISYQGFLTDANGIPLATNTPLNFNVLFKIYNDPSASATANLLWGESQVVTVDRGFFTVLLGAGSAIPGIPNTNDLTSLFVSTNAQSRYVGITVLGLATPPSPDTEMAPRLRLLASPYALLAANAVNAATAATVTGNGVIEPSQIDTTTIGLWSVSSSGIYYPNGSGNVGIGNSNPGFPLSFADLNGDKISFHGLSGPNVGIGLSGHVLQIHSDDINGDIAFGYGSSASLTENMRIRGNGNVGIGTSNPQGILHLVTSHDAIIRTDGSQGLGQAGLRMIAGSGSTYRATRLDFLNAPSDPNKPQWTFINDYNQNGVNDFSLLDYAGSFVMNFAQSGNVGIGTRAAGALLQLNSAVQSSERLRLSGTEFYQGFSASDGISFLLGVNRSNNRQLWIADSALTASSPVNPVIRISPTFRPTIDAIATDGVTLLPISLGANGALTVNTNGDVGIGTGNPSRATFSVLGGNSQDTIAPNGYLFVLGAGIEGQVTENTSIYSDGAVHAFIFRAASDERIKLIHGQSDGAADLSKLLGIKITDYTYKDKIAKTSSPQKKVIGQQLETVFPQAVARTTDVVPDIYQKASIKDGWVSLATDLKAGDRVRLIGEKDQGVFDVLEARDGAFRTAFNPKGDQVFVYGREVKDFRVVDYEAIAMLNVSATQELARKLEASQAQFSDLHAEVARLRAERDGLARHLAALEARDEAREARLVRLEAGLGDRSVHPVRASLERQ